MKLLVCKNYEEMSLRAAELIKAQINEKPDSVLGLPTGSTPVGTYSALINMYKAEEVDFSKVTTFNLDEYYPIKKSDEQSYDTFMHLNFFNHINVCPDNIHLPNGGAADPVKECIGYDKMIEAAGGIDLQLLGIGRNGHIGFNEPDADGLVAPTHMTSLTEDTIDANSRFFASADEVPTHALTMGMASILFSKKILIIISGENKAEALSLLLSDKITTMSPATLLKVHKDVTIICDEACYNNI